MDAGPIELRFAGTMAGFAEAFGKLRQVLDDGQLAAKTRYGVELVFEEIVANIVRHGSFDGVPPGVQVSLDLAGDEVVLVFEDDGTPFDPSGRSDPDLPSSLDEATVGGLGLMMVRRAVTRMEYHRTPDYGNRLVVALPATRPQAVG